MVVRWFKRVSFCFLTGYLRCIKGCQSAARKGAGDQDRTETDMENGRIRRGHLLFLLDGSLEHESPEVREVLQKDERRRLMSWVKALAEGEEKGKEEYQLVFSRRTSARLVLMKGEGGERWLAEVEVLEEEESGGAKIEALTERQRDVVRCALDGSTSREIGEKLQLSPHTVKTHIKNIYQRLGIGSRVELLQYYYEYESDAATEEGGAGVD